MHNKETVNSIITGMRDSVPIALGYLAVGTGLGITMHNSGMTVLQGAVMSFSCVTSAGEFAGVRIIAAGSGLTELILTQLIINLRYSLMSLGLSQKLDKSVTFFQKLIIAFANTDEIFAVSMNRSTPLPLPYMLGLEWPPILCWTLGTVLGSVASSLLPDSVSNAMNIMLYGMFIAIVVPQAKTSRPVLIVAVTAVLLSCLFYYAPLFNRISDGISIVICTVIASSLGALLFPIPQEEMNT